MKFNERLKKLMSDLNLNQKQVAGMTGCSRASVSQWLSGINVPNESKQEDIAVSLGLAADYFRKNEEPAKSVRRGLIERMTTEDVARCLGINHHTAALGLQQGCFPWGYAIHMPSGKWVYVINKQRFMQIEGVQ